MRTVLDIVEKLDRRRPEVLVQAIIAEVDVDKTDDLGINWAAYSPNGKVPLGSFASPVAGTSIVDLIGAATSGSAALGNAASLLSGTTIGVGSIATGGGESFAAMIRALRSNGDTNIVSTPSAVTMDNQQATLKVVDEVPFVTGQYSSQAGITNGTVTPFQTIQQQEVGTILKVTPTISAEGNAVMLKLSVENSSVLATSLSAASANPTTAKRSISTNVLIENGGVVVLGGLIDHEQDRTHDSVPFLGSIPLIGLLFKSRNDSSKRDNLMIFIKPTILRDQSEAARQTGATYGYMLDQENSIPPEQFPRLLRGEPAPHLAPLPPPPPPGTLAAPSPLTPVPPKEKSKDKTPPTSGQAAPAPLPAGRAEPGQPRAQVQQRRRAAERRQPLNAAEVMDEPQHVQALAAPQRKLSFAFAKRHGVLIKQLSDGEAECICREHVSPLALAELRRFVGRPVRLERVPEPEFDLLLREIYEAGSDTMQAVEGLDETTDLAHLALELPEQADLLDSDDDAPIIRLINAVLTQAVKENASDIHVEPFENRLVVRFRVDGVLREVLQSKRAVAPLVVSRIKVMSKLDIAEKRLPQDGRISLRIAGRAVDVRVSTIPSGHGERVVLRILDKQAGRLDLTALGMDPKTEGLIDELIHKPHGIILVTGPTGSGKTTTLYAALERLNDNSQNIMTVEDPIEYYIDGIGQTQVNTKVEMTFARGLQRDSAPGPGRRHDR